VTVKIALPKGRLLETTSALLQAADWGLEGYEESMRNYRLQSRRFTDLQAKVFNERDIPVQVAIGNYDLGICGLDWVEELSVKFTSAALVRLRDLGYGEGMLCLATSRAQSIPTIEELREETDLIRIASEYPNLAEHLALSQRLRRFSIFPLWGAAEAYPPESATLALLSCRTEQDITDRGLIPVRVIQKYSALLIANRSSWEKKNLSQIVESIDRQLPVSVTDRKKTATTRPAGTGHQPWQVEEDTVRLALPDGHQQAPTAKILGRAGIRVDDYPSENGNRRPNVDIKGIVAKVIRPQDMPLQVANGNFDLAITGRDWLTDHLTVFPSSPATELLDLKSSRVRIVAVVSNEVPADDIFGLRQLVTRQNAPFRVASEYVNIADRYARDNHLGMYKVIPTWGATEAFLPEDADLLIENTETGRTIARHNLKIIDTLFKSTGCLIGNKDATTSPLKQKRIRLIVDKLEAAVGRDKIENHQGV
jgi:ATP phosphoribosyltransferase